jgi:glycosyltransferase involved in cell wall biosynthesis
MRIGVDARELSGRVTGVGRYLAGLLTEWERSAAARRHEFVLYAAGPLAISLDAHRFPARQLSGTPGTWWEQVRLPAACVRDHVDVLFAPAYTAPLFGRLPFVVTIHDVSFVAHPEWFGTREGLRRRWVTRRAAHRARAVIAVSDFTRQELIERLAVRAGNIHVVRSGIDPPRTPAPGEPSAPRVLFVGSTFNRRHVPDLIRAFEPIARAHADATLDIVGDNRSYPRQDLAAAIAAAGLTGKARWRSYVSDDELRGLYGGARAFAFLSEYEGFGMTPLEALAAGVPAVLLDTPIARESCGEAALYVPAGDLAVTTRALHDLLFDDSVRRRILAAAPGVLARYQWPRAAADTLRVIEQSLEPLRRDAVDHHR